MLSGLAKAASRPPRVSLGPVVVRVTPPPSGAQLPSRLWRRLTNAMRSDSRTTIIHWPGATGPEPPDRLFSRPRELLVEVALAVAFGVYVPVTTTSPATRPLVIWVSDEVVIPVVTSRAATLPFLRMRTKLADVVPLTALVGTTSTFVRWAIVTVSEPVMPDLTDVGTFGRRKVTS